MFKFEPITPVRGDCTRGYNVVLDKEYTVEEFIETVFKELSGEWGYFSIHNKEGDFYEPRCEYSYGKLSTPPLPDEYLKKKIMKVTGDGGWSRMDYQFWIE